MDDIWFRIEIDFCLFGKWFIVFDCVGVARSVFRPGLGWVYLAEIVCQVGREGGEWWSVGVHQPQPGTWRERESVGWTKTERDITGLLSLSWCGWTSHQPPFYWIWKPFSFILQREREVLFCTGWCRENLPTIGKDWQWNMLGWPGSRNVCEL